MNEEIKFLVAKETYKYTWCSVCKGSGQVEKRFQRRMSKVSCTNCRGTGKSRIKHRTEVPLEEAIKALTTKTHSNDNNK